MPVYVTWFLMLLPPAGSADKPAYVKAFPDAVSCQMRVIELRDEQPGKSYECRAFKGAQDLTKPAPKTGK